MTAALWAMELSAERRFERYHRMLNRAQWLSRQGARMRLRRALHVASIARHKILERFMNGLELEGLTLEGLLPHRDGMLLIEDVLEVDAVHARTLSRVRSSWPLTDAHGAESLICVELAAQTAGVCNGWDRIQTQGLNSNQMGWLVAVKRADLLIDRLPLGTQILVSAENTLVFENFREITSELYLDGQLAASVVLQLFQVGS